MSSSSSNLQIRPPPTPLLLLLLLLIMAHTAQTTIHRHYYCANQEGTKSIMCTNPEQVIGNATIIATVFKPNSGSCVPNQAADNRLVETKRATPLNQCIGRRNCQIMIGSPQTIGDNAIDHYEVSIDCYHVIEMCGEKRDYVGLDGFVVSPSYPSRFTRSSCELYISLAATDLEIVLEIHEFSLMYSIGCVSQYLELITDESSGKKNDTAKWTQLYLWCGRLTDKSNSSITANTNQPYGYKSHRNVPPSNTIRLGTNNLFIVLTTAKSSNLSASAEDDDGQNAKSIANENEIGGLFKIRFWGAAKQKSAPASSTKPTIPCARKPNATTQHKPAIAQTSDTNSKKHKRRNLAALILISVASLILTVGAVVALVFVLKRRSPHTQQRKSNKTQTTTTTFKCCDIFKRLGGCSCRKGKRFGAQNSKTALNQPAKHTQSPPQPRPRPKLIPERILNVEDMHFTKPISEELLKTEVYGASGPTHPPDKKSSPPLQNKDPTDNKDQQSLLSQEMKSTDQTEIRVIIGELMTKSLDLAAEDEPTAVTTNVEIEISPATTSEPTTAATITTEPYPPQQLSSPPQQEQQPIPNPLNVLFKRNSSIYYTTDFV